MMVAVPQHRAARGASATARNHRPVQGGIAMNQPTPERSPRHRFARVAIALAALVVTAGSAVTLLAAAERAAPAADVPRYPYAYSLLSPSSIADLIPRGH
jgi:hypothetical protein